MLRLMACRVLPFAALALVLLGVAGCSNYERPRRPAWRAQADNACIAERLIHLSRFVQPRDRDIDGPGICGLTKPFLVGALNGDRVQLDTVATLDCPMTSALDRWVAEVVQPVAQARFGQPVVQIDTMGSYSCRGMNGQMGAKISEHAFGNALDIGGFRLADGRRITVVHDWTRGDEQTQAFLRDVHAGACSSFTTVLGPGANVFHYNHIHVDLAMHGNSSTGPRRICKPLPQESAPGPRRDFLPDPPPVEEEEDIAGAEPPPVPRGLHPGPASLVAQAPEAMPAKNPPPGYLYDRSSQGYRGALAASPAKNPPPGYLYDRSSQAYQSAPPPYRSAPPPGGLVPRDSVAPEGTPHDWDSTSSIPHR